MDRTTWRRLSGWSFRIHDRLQPGHRGPSCTQAWDLQHDSNWSMLSHMQQSLCFWLRSSKSSQKAQNIVAQRLRRIDGQLQRKQASRPICVYTVSPKLCYFFFTKTSVNYFHCYEFDLWWITRIVQKLHQKRILRSTHQLLLDCPRFSTEFDKRSFSFSYLAPQSGMICLLT